MPLLAALVAGGVFLAEDASALPTEVFFDDFNVGISTSWSNFNLATSPIPPNPLGQYHGNYTLSQFTTLSLTGLPAHTQLALEFDLYLFQSWDGSNTTSGPDSFSLAGGIAFSETFTNHQPAGQSYPGTPDETYGNPGASQTHVYRGLGPIGSGSEFLIAHSGSTFDVIFGGPTTQTDEQWGIDNVRVTIGGDVTPIPEPATLTLFGTGLALLGLALRRRRKAA